MFKSISAFLMRYASGRFALASMTVFLVFSALTLPGQSAAAEAYSGGFGSPDTSLFYTAQDLYRMAEAYGPQGRADYIRARFTFDLAFPIVYGVFLVACLGWLLGRTLETDSRGRLIILAPILAVLFDFLENICTSLVISRYPALSPLPAVLAPFFTFVKWVFVGGSFLLLAGFFVAYILKKRLAD